MPLDLSVIILLVLIFLSSVFSGTESALFSLDTILRERLKRVNPEKNRKKIRIILGWLAKPEQTLGILLLGNLTVNIFITETGHQLVETLSPAGFEHVELVSMVSITFLLLIFGEIIPKVIALQSAIRWSLFYTRPIQAFTSFARIIAMPIISLSKKIARVFPDSEIPLSEKELLESIQLADSFGTINSDELQILKHSITYHYDTAYSAMIPQSKVHFLAHDTTPEKCRRYFIEKKCQLALVYHHKEGNILGYIQTRGLLLALAARQRTIKTSAQNISFLPETMPLQEVVEYFIKNQSEVAAVNDENGKVSGIVLLKGILSKLMGDAAEGAQKSFRAIEKVSSDQGEYYRLKGSLSLSEFNDYFHATLEAEDLETLSGFLLNQLDGFPREATVYRYRQFEFFNFAVEDYRIIRVFMRKVKAK